jgi:UPF0176 protein
MKQQILLFYIYRTIEDTTALLEREKAVWSVLGLRGRMIIAEEGINGTLEGSIENTDMRFKHIEFKTSPGTGSAFPRISIKVRSEIVSTGLPSHINPRTLAAPRVTVKQLHKMYQKNEDFVVVDMRNIWEIAAGKFSNAIDPGMQASRDLPSKIELIKQAANGKKVVAVCNGGVRCEKMSTYLLDQGMDNVYQLHNGIHSYMQAYPGENFEGTLYTFDDRTTMDFTNDRKIVGSCKLCSKASENYINCSKDKCHLFCIVCSDCGGDEEIVFCSIECRQTAKRVIPTMKAVKVK